MAQKAKLGVWLLLCVAAAVSSGCFRCCERYDRDACRCERRYEERRYEERRADDCNDPCAPRSRYGAPAHYDDR
jgi:hypothetical protein